MTHATSGSVTATSFSSQPMKNQLQMRRSGQKKKKTESWIWFHLRWWNGCTVDEMINSRHHLLFPLLQETTPTPIFRREDPLHHNWCKLKYIPILVVVVLIPSSSSSDGSVWDSPHDSLSQPKSSSSYSNIIYTREDHPDLLFYFLWTLNPEQQNHLPPPHLLIFLQLPLLFSFGFIWFSSLSLIFSEPKIETQPTNSYILSHLNILLILLTGLQEKDTQHPRQHQEDDENKSCISIGVLNDCLDLKKMIMMMMTESPDYPLLSSNPPILLSHHAKYIRNMIRI